MSKKTPMDILLDKVEWEAIAERVETVFPESRTIIVGEKELPVATHKGILRLGGCELKVFQLSDGTRVIDAEDFHKFFGLGTA